jgi:hypothetical protein
MNDKYSNSSFRSSKSVIYSALAGFVNRVSWSRRGAGRALAGRCQGAGKPYSRIDWSCRLQPTTSLLEAPSLANFLTGTNDFAGVKCLGSHRISSISAV